MRRYLLIVALQFSVAAYAQTPLFYQSNYPRIVQPDIDNIKLKYVDFSNTTQKYDTLLNPFTGGMNNPAFFSIDLNNDGVKDLFVFDRELNENQFLLFQADSKNSLTYRFAPQYESAFPQDMTKWADLVDYNKDGLPDIFSASSAVNTSIMVYKNISKTDPGTKKFNLQFQKVADTLFYYNDTGGRMEIDITTASDPQFIDVDKDGFIDILGFDEGLNQVYFFRNKGKGKDSLTFYFNCNCWGRFEESIQHLYTPWDCTHDSKGHSVYTGTYDPSGYHKTGAHIANSICAMDVEPDGDIDLLLGDGLNDSLAFLRNGRDKYNKDTMVNISYHHDEDSFPINEPAVIHTMPTASNLDINHDNLKDLIVAAGEPTYLDSFSNARLHNIWYYANTGDSITPVNIFSLATKDFLQNTYVDWGINSAPCFIDVDKDGTPDLLIAVKDGGDGSGSKTDKGFSHLILYLAKKGEGPNGKPSFIYQTNDYLGFSKLSVPIEWPIPAAYHNGKDGKTDLLFGNDSGRVMYFKDMSSGTSAANFQLVQSSLKYLSNGKMLPIWVGNNSAPTAVDINHDGKMDLLIGSNTGNISYYRCQGYGPAPDYIPYFVMVTKTFGNINPTTSIYRQTAPCVADFDKDGKPDLITGDILGDLFYYHDFDTISTLVPSTQSLVYDYGTGKRSTGKLFSTYTVPAVAYIDQDTFPDLMLGCRRGGLIFLGSNNNPVEKLRNSGIEESMDYNSIEMRMFPNPTRDNFTLRYDNTGEIQHTSLIITDMLGRQLISHPFVMGNGHGNELVNTTGFSNGIYLVNVIKDGQIIFSNKLVINK